MTDPGFEYVHRLDVQGRSVTLTWVGESNMVPARVYALAFVSPNRMLLLSGGVEPGESPEQALRRELFEEADATIVALEALGSQRMDDPQTGREYHRVYWCRVTLARQDFPRAESSLRHFPSSRRCSGTAISAL